MLAEIWCWFDTRAIDGKKLPVSHVSPVNPWMQQQTPASQVPPFLHFGSLSFPHNANKNQSRLKPYIQNYLQAPVACVPCSILTDFAEWPCVVRCTLTSPQVACCSGIHAFAVNGVTQNWREKAGKNRFYRTPIDKNKTLSDYFHLPISQRAPV